MSAPASRAGAGTVRTAKRADAPELARLHGLCFARGWDTPVFARFIADPAGLLLIAEARGAVAGFIIARSAGIEADIVTLAVASQARRAGVATQLVSALANDLRARGAEALFLEVGEENEAALSLYRRAGFRNAARRTGYYAVQGDAPSQDALLLRLDLS